MKATVAGHIEVVEILVDAGANVDLKDMVSETYNYRRDLKLTVREHQCTSCLAHQRPCEDGFIWQLKKSLLTCSIYVHVYILDWSIGFVQCLSGGP